MFCSFRYDRGCLELEGVNANTNFPLAEYETELAASALLSVGGSCDFEQQPQPIEQPSKARRELVLYGCGK